MSGGEVVKFPGVPSVPSVSSIGDVLDEVEAYYRRYVVFHSDYTDAESCIIALWTAHTWAFQAAEATPYMLVTAPTPEAGKSRLVDVAHYLVRNPHVAIDPSPASTFRIIDGQQPTFFIDEVDTLAESRVLTAVLNAGYRVGGVVTRVNGKGNVDKFHMFCPKMFAGIEGVKPPIKNATLSRCIRIPMRRKSKSETAERFTHKQARVETVDIRDRLRMLLTGDETIRRLSHMVPDMPSHLSDRQEEVLEPLVALADLAGGDWPKRAREAASKLTKSVRTQPDSATQLLADLREVWDKVDGQREHTQVLLDIWHELDDHQYLDELNIRSLQQRIASFGIHPVKNSFRKGGFLRRGYRRADFQDAFERYLPRR